MAPSPGERGAPRQRALTRSQNSWARGKGWGGAGCAQLVRVLAPGGGFARFARVSRSTAPPPRQLAGGCGGHRVCPRAAGCPGSPSLRPRRRGAPARRPARGRRQTPALRLRQHRAAASACNLLGNFTSPGEEGRGAEKKGNRERQARKSFRPRRRYPFARTPGNLRVCTQLGAGEESRSGMYKSRLCRPKTEAEILSCPQPML